MPDIIEINRLKVSSHIGVPDEERAKAQSLWITARLVPSQSFDHLNDAIEHTIDYQAVADQLSSLAAAKSRKLIETLATEAADLLLSNYPLDETWIRIEKQILPDTDCVAVELTRRA
ncbi:MAG: dihydroneopterin aldolase [Luteolibacter sp.]